MKREFKIQIETDESINKTNLFDSNNYPRTGLFLVEENLYLCLKENLLVQWLGHVHSFSKFIEEEVVEPKATKETNISEDFALKLVAIASGYVEKIDFSGPNYKADNEE